MLEFVAIIICFAIFFFLSVIVIKTINWWVDYQKYNKHQIYILFLLMAGGFMDALGYIAFSRHIQSWDISNVISTSVESILIGIFFIIPIVAPLAELFRFILFRLKVISIPSSNHDHFIIDFSISNLAIGFALFFFVFFHHP